MQRKVAQIGPATLMVSLPSKWVKRQGVKKGDEIEIKDAGNSLVLSIDKTKIIEKTSFDTTNLDEQTIKWTLGAMHKAGYDEIEINYSGKDTAKIIQEMVKDVLMGFAIVDQTDKKIVLRSVAQDISSEFDAAFRRAFLVTIALAENSLELIKSKKFDELEGLINLEKTNNQLTNFCERIINKYGMKDEKLKSFWYVIVWNLEKICDNYKDICQIKFKSVDKEVIDYYNEVNLVLKEYYELFYKFDFLNLSKLDIKSKSIESKGKAILNKNNELMYNLVKIASETRNFFASTIALNQTR